MSDAGIRVDDMTQTLCEFCQHKREITSGTGSHFLLCQLSQQDRRYPKYPPQPVVKCSGYEVRKEQND